MQQYTATGDRLVIGCFSAASNVTGILSDTYTISVMLHKYGALAFWDYATAGAHVVFVIILDERLCFIINHDSITKHVSYNPV